MASKKRNVIVGQSGGPTSVINSSLAGVNKNAIERGFDKVYGMLHGVQGLLDEQYVDMSTQIHSDLDIELLKRTPSAFLGSCRYKLPEIHENMEIYDRIFEILDKLEAERTVRGYTRNLVVAATGTGKTVISALDYKRVRKQNPDRPCRLLFVAHREEILKQS